MKRSIHHLIILSFIALLLSTGAPATQAQSPAFQCGATLYIMQNQPAQLYTIDRSASPYNLTTIGTPTVTYNAIGFNPIDNYIYGFALNTTLPGNPAYVYQIDDSGGVTSIGNLPTLDDTPNEWWSGTFTETGTYIIVGNGPPPRIVSIDVTTATIISDNWLIPATSAFYDIAVNPLNGLIYGYNETTDRMATLDLSGTVTDFGNVQPNYSPASTFFDVFGTLYAYSWPPGGGARDRFYTVNLTSGDFTEVSTGPGVVFSDGASCPFGLGITKDVSPSPAEAGSIVTYTYRISNQGENAVPGDFTDTMADGRTFIPGTLTNPCGGSVSFSGGNTTMTISSMNLPANSINTITIDVQTAPDVTGTVYNQATIDNLPVRLEPSFNSDYPPTAGFPDRTPLELIEASSQPPPPQPQSTPEPQVILVDPKITKAVNVASANIGDAVIYTIDIYNNGMLPFPDASVSDSLPSVLDIEQVIASKGTVTITGNDVTIDIGTLQPGERVNVTINARVNQTGVAGSIFRNTAYLADNEGNLWPSNTVDTAIGLGVTILPETGTP